MHFQPIFEIRIYVLSGTLMPAKFEEEIKKDNQSFIRSQLESGRPVPVDIRNKASQSGLMLACQAKSFKTVQVFLKNKADVNAVDASGWTALHYASQSCCIKSLKLVIAQCANVNAETNDHQLAIHIVLKERNLECFKFLIDQEPKNVYGQIPL
jgi:ankyrin repeat protein